MTRQPVASIEMSRRLPPPEAWKEPEAWLDMRTGLRRKGAEKFDLPADDRGIILPDRAVKFVLQKFFKSDYDWPYDPTNLQTKPNRHHFHYEKHLYLPENNNGDDLPLRFRELPSLIGYMPQQLHNTFHDFTNAPGMPEHDSMSGHVEAYGTAHHAFLRVYNEAAKIIEVQPLFPSRRAAVAAGLITPKDPEDQIGEDIMRSTFNKHFQGYAEAIETFYSMEHHEAFYTGDDLLRVTPKRAIRKLGQAAVNPPRYLRFLPDVLQRIIA